MPEGSLGTSILPDGTLGALKPPICFLSLLEDDELLFFGFLNFKSTSPDGFFPFISPEGNLGTFMFPEYFLSLLEELEFFLTPYAGALKSTFPDGIFTFFYIFRFPELDEDELFFILIPGGLKSTFPDGTLTPAL